MTDRRMRSRHGLVKGSEWRPLLLSSVFGAAIALVIVLML